MSVWRRKALALFPEMQHDLQKPDWTIYWLFFDLLPLVRKAHVNADDEMLRRIYGYAEWCLHQPNKELWNPAAVAFYEHLFDSPRIDWSAIVRWLSPQVVKNLWSLWELMADAEDLEEIKRLHERMKPRYRESVFYTGEIEHL